MSRVRRCAPMARRSLHNQRPRGGGRALGGGGGADLRRHTRYVIAHVIQINGAHANVIASNGVLKLNYALD